MISGQWFGARFLGIVLKLKFRTLDYYWPLVTDWN